jgi:hypothetical protein
MVASTTIKCNYCNKRILARFQVGYNNIPFDFYCPCGVSINGKYILDNTKLELVNAKEVDTNLDEIDYYINLSSEFYSKKLAEYKGFDDMISNGLTPFMISIMCFEDDNIVDVGRRVSIYLDYQKNDWTKIKPLYELFFNNKIELIKQPINEYSFLLDIENTLDAYMALHQINIIKFSNIFDEDILKKYIEITHDIFNVDKNNELLKFIEYIKEKENFTLLSKKIFEVYNEWIENFDKFLPIVYMSFANNKKLSKEEYGITTINFDSLKSFYVKSYELILELLLVPVGLNNIFERGEYNLFYEESKAKNFDSYFLLNKYDRVYTISDDDKFSKYLNLNRHVRNSISHFDYEYDKLTQLIIFYDRFKGKCSKNQMYLRDFAEICFDNFKLLVYLNELFYSIRKVDFVSSGNIIHIKESFE